MGSLLLGATAHSASGRPRISDPLSKSEHLQLGAVLGTSCLTIAEMEATGAATAAASGAQRTALAPPPSFAAGVGGPPVPSAGGEAARPAAAISTAASASGGARAPPRTTTREVTGHDGTFEEAVVLGLVPKPPNMQWGSWMKWRKRYGALPSTEGLWWKDSPRSRGQQISPSPQALLRTVLQGLVLQTMPPASRGYEP